MTLVAVAQLSPAFGEVAQNLDQIESAVHQGADDGAQIVVLPELATTGYCFADQAEARGLAEPLTGPALRRISRLAHDRDVLIALSLATVDAEDRLRNTGVLLDASGLRASYHKVHSWGRESEIFHPGNTPPPVVRTRHGRVGLMVCYDLEFPEWVRMAALAGADLLCCPVNWPDPRPPAGQVPFEVNNALVAAGTNGIFVAVADRVGDERGTSWVGGSVIAGPHGYPLTEVTLDGAARLITAPCDLPTARDKSVGAHNNRFADRRPSMYRFDGGAA